MKKKIVFTVIGVLAAMSLAACGSAAESAPQDVAQPAEQVSEQAAEPEAPEETVEEATNSVERDLPEGDYEEVGDGTFYLVSQSGSTENGDEIVIYPDMESYPHGDVGIELWDMDGSVQTFIYIDGVEMDKQQVGAGYHGYIDFYDEEMWALTEGEHVVEAVQYADNTPGNEMTFYRSETYTVKN